MKCTYKIMWHFKSMLSSDKPGSGTRKKKCVYGQLPDCNSRWMWFVSCSRCIYFSILTYRHLSPYQKPVWLPPPAGAQTGYLSLSSASFFLPSALSSPSPLHPALFSSYLCLLPINHSILSVLIFPPLPRFLCFPFLPSFQLDIFLLLFSLFAKAFLFLSFDTPFLPPTPFSPFPSMSSFRS